MDSLMMAGSWLRQKTPTIPSGRWQDADSERKSTKCKIGSIKIGDHRRVYPDDLGINVINHTVTEEVESIVHQAMEAEHEESIGVFDMGFVVGRYTLWKECFPDIHPFYAVKTYSDPAVVKLLTYLGAGMDCACKMEVQLALDAGADPSNIIFANTIKFPTHIRFASNAGVRVMTFDNKEELVKIKKIAPSSSLILRLPAQKHDNAQLGSDRFGCQLEDVAQLLQDALLLGLNIVGVSFHAGSGIKDPDAYIANFKAARAVFDIAQEQGIRMSILDIGGGFYGSLQSDIWLKKMCGPINESLESLFPEQSGVTIISEPGRYFVEGGLTLLICVIGKTVKKLPKDQSIPESTGEVLENEKAETLSFEYATSESVFGTFSLLHHYAPGYDFQFVPVTKKADAGKKYVSKVYGPTCAPPDVIQESCLLPELDLGDWLMVKNIAHYGPNMASSFNGIPLCPIRRVMHKDLFEKMPSMQGKK